MDNVIDLKENFLEDKDNISLKETSDYYPLSVFFHDNGVGVPVTNITPEKMIKMWKIENNETGEILAAVTLQIRAGVYALGSLAVHPDYRSKGYGALLQQLLFEEAKKHGATEVWCCARLPEYYLKCGWEESDWETSPKVDVNCLTCGKLGKTCFPVILKKRL